MSIYSAIPLPNSYWYMYDLKIIQKLMKMSENYDGYILNRKWEGVNMCTNAFAIYTYI